MPNLLWGRTKRNGSALLFYCCLGVVLLATRPGPVHGQVAARSLDRLVVELWPDYDRQAVLVLLTGTLPPDLALPATITLPLPADAELNAVARISEVEGMIDDIAYAAEGGQLSLTTPDPRFRVEYYVPYQLDGDQRTYLFGWSSELAIEAFQVRVQQPRHAAELVTSLQPELITSEGGLRYHNFAAQRLAPGEMYNLEVSYRLSPNQLSATGPAATQGAAEAESLPTGVLLALVGLGGLLLGAAAVWLISNRSARSPIVRKPRPRRTERSQPKPAAQRRPTVKFCHQCGHPRQSGDRFCRSCGAALRRDD